MPIALQSAEEAYLSVLNHAGATAPGRDAVDNRVITDVRLGIAT